MTDFRWPDVTNRTVILGATGSGKSTCGLWFLSHMDFSIPWVAVDWKAEAMFDAVGFPPIKVIGYGDIPRKPGLYLLSPKPGEEEILEAWLWAVWKAGRIGLYLDEAMLMPDIGAMRAILQQGRSKHLPVIACSQRPVDIPRAFFSEASFFCLYRLNDKRDYKTVEGFVPVGDLSRTLPEHYWRWYDVARNRLLTFAPVPAAGIVDDLKAAIPYQWHPFQWMTRPGER